MSWMREAHAAQEGTDHRRSLGRAGDATDFGPADATSSSAGAGLIGVVIGRWRRWIVPVGVVMCYALFAVAVHFGKLDSLDLAVRRMVRPTDAWGLLQIRAARVVNDLKPTHVAISLLLFTAVLSLLRRSLRPFVVVAIIGVPAAIVAFGTKWIMGHTYRGATPDGHSSFPSGHTLAFVIAFGLLVLLLRPGTRWGWLLPALMGCLIGCAVVLAWVHPATDVIGGGLLAAAALSGATAARLGQWASHRRPRSLR